MHALPQRVRVAPSQHGRLRVARHEQLQATSALMSSSDGTERLVGVTLSGSSTP
jgi:hypothetical protein